MSRTWLLGAGLAAAVVVSVMGDRAPGDAAAKNVSQARQPETRAADDPFSAGEAAKKECQPDRPDTTSHTSSTKRVPAPKPAEARLSASAAREKIEQALASPTQLEFIETPLSDVVAYLKDYHAIEIQLDKKAMDDAGIAAETPVTKNLKGISLQSALRIALRELGLTYAIHDETLWFTTPDADPLTTKVYDVADLAVNGREGRQQDDYKMLISALTQTLEPGSWQPNGGRGCVVGGTFGGARVLSVSQTYRVHREIESFLASLRGAK